MYIKEPLTKHSLEDLLFAFQKNIVDAIRPQLKDLNCSFPQMELLRYLHDEESISLTEVARLLSISKPSASVMIDGLEARGLVRRHTPPEDRRSTIITLTPKSRKLVHTIAEKKKKVIAVLLKKMNRKEQAELSLLLTKLIND